MKKLMGILSSLFPTFSVVSTIVSCDSSEEKTDETTDDFNHDGNGGNNNLIEEQKEVLTESTKELFEEQLGSTGVDGTGLSTLFRTIFI